MATQRGWAGWILVSDLAELGFMNADGTRVSSDEYISAWERLTGKKHFEWPT